MLLDRPRVLRPPAEPCDRLGDAQRVVRADRLAQLGSVEQADRGDGDAGAQAIDAVRVVVERERRELLEVGRVDAARQADDEEAVEVAGAHLQVAGPRGRPRLAEVDQRGHDGRDQQPRALGGGLGIGAEGGGRRRGGEQHAASGRDRDLHRRVVVARARLLQLVAAVPQRAQQHGAQPRGRGRRRDDAAEG